MGGLGRKIGRALALGLVVLGAALPSLAATDTVTSLADDGSAGTLRSVLANAASGDTIVFGVSGTITLSTGQLEIIKNLTISGPGAASLTISGSDEFRVFQVDNAVTATVSGVTIANGDGFEGYAGGINNLGTLTVSNSTITGNDAEGDGGGIYNDGVMTLSNSTISGNSGIYGGGIFNTGTLTVTNSTLSGNSANYGGGISNKGTLTMANSTLTGNTSEFGGIFNDVSGSLTLKGTILTNGTQGGNCSLGSVQTSDGYNLSDDNTCSFLTATGDQTNISNAGTLLGSLANNGGPTQTIALLPGSTAIDAIPPQACTDVFGNLVATDQRGVRRPQGSGCDIGAYELAQPVTANVCPKGIGPAPCSAAIAVNFTIPAGTTLNATSPVSVVTQGAPNLDFQLSGTQPATGACTAGLAGPAVCTVNATFAPLSPGVRMGAVSLTGSNGNAAATTLISGTGQGPAVAFAPGTILTVAGNGGPGYSGDGGSATGAAVGYPVGVARDSAGNLYIAQFNNRVLVVYSGSGTIPGYPNPSYPTLIAGNIYTVAGNGTNGYNGDGIAATSAELSQPYDVALDGAGNLYIAESSGNRVRMVSALTGIISTVAGNGTLGYNGDGIAATSAELNSPQGVALDGAGNLYIVDCFNDRIRMVSASTGIISTVAGNGTQGYNGDGIAATSAELNQPVGMALDSAGNLFIADNENQRVREVSASTGIISTVAGNGTYGYNGDGIAATSAELGQPVHVALDSADNLYFADRDNNRIREVSASTGIISTVAGNGTQGYNGDGIAANKAELDYPYGIALDGAGDLYIADFLNNRVRAVTAAGRGLAFFAPTKDGTTDITDGTQTVTATNIGNQPLIFSGLSYGADFSAANDANACSSTITLASGAGCDLPVEFTPVLPSSGPLSESVTLTDNALNAVAAQQLISLSGTAIATIPISPGKSSLTASPNPAVAGSSVTVTATLEDGSGNTINGATVTFGGASATASFSNGGVGMTNGSGVASVTLTDTAAETLTLTATVSGVSSGTLNPANAQFVAPSYIVSTNTDPTSGSGTAANCVDVNLPSYSTAANQNCELRDAVAAANALSGVITNIGFGGSAVGTVGNPAVIQIAQSTPITINQSVNINGPGANLLTIEGGVAPSTSNLQVFTMNLPSTGSSTLAGVTIANGYAYQGGGVYLGSGTLTLAKSIFSGNQAGLAGGAIESLGNSTLTVTNSSFLNNSLTNPNCAGGAIFATSALAVTNSTFSGNQANNGDCQGGAIAADSTLTVSNSTFSNNQSNGPLGLGGAIVADSALTVANSTFSKNQSNGQYGAGGAIVSLGDSQLTVTNSIFAGDSSFDDLDIYAVSGGTVAYSVNDGEAFHGVTSINVVSGDPNLAPLGNYGGPTQTMLPLPGSAAICAGSAADATAAGLTTDQRGDGIDSNCPAGGVDIGAVQTGYSLTGSFSLPPSPILPNTTLPTQTFTVSEIGGALPAASATVTVSDQQNDLGASTTSGSNLADGSVSFTNLAFSLPEATDTLTATLTLNPALATGSAPPTAPLNLTVASGSFQVGKLTPTVTFTGAPPSAAYGTTFPVATTTTDTGNTPTITGTAGVCTVSGNMVTMISGTGTCTLTATWAADSTYNGASLNQSTMATKIVPTVAFTGAPSTTPYQSGFTVASKTNASTTASIISSGACSNNGNAVTMTSGTGTCLLTATWAADSNYSGASLNQSTTATKLTPVITWKPASIPLGYTLGSAQLDASAATVGGTFVYTPPSGTQVTTLNLTLNSVFTPTLTADYNSVNSSVPLTVTAGPLASVSPTSINFGTVYLGSTTTRVVTLTNIGNAPMTVSRSFLSILQGGNSDEFLEVNQCPATLAPGKSCPITAVFYAGPYYTPQTVSLNISDSSPGSPQTIPATATVIDPVPQFSKQTVNFAATKVGTASAAQTVTITNVGATALTVTGITISGADKGDFTETNNCTAALAPKGSCTVSFTFKPTAKGSRTATAVIADNAENSTQNIGLAGTGN